MECSDKYQTSTAITAHRTRKEELSFDEHSIFESAVTEAARELQVSREMAMMCAFGAMTTACQGRIDVETPTGQRIPTSLMLLTIAESGERKTATQNYFFDEINTLNSEASRASDSALLQQRHAHQVWNVSRRSLERKYNKYAIKEDEISSQKALNDIAEHMTKEPKLPRSGKFLYEDTTPQALVQMLYENTPNGCVLTSEANSIFSGKALNELDKLNTLWDGGNVIVDRISRKSFILQNARLTLSLMVQPSVITAFMGRRGEEARGSGFLARLLVTKPDSLAGQREYKSSASLPRKQAFNSLIRERFFSSSQLDRQTLKFSESAANCWREYSLQLEREMQESGPLYYLRDHAAKLLENVSRLAAILHTFERKTESETSINLPTLQSCGKFARSCSKNFREHIADEPQHITDANNLAHYLLKTSTKIGNSSAATSNQLNSKTVHLPSHLRPGLINEFSLTDIKQCGPGSLRGRGNAKRLDTAIVVLQKLGHIIKNANRYKFSETILHVSPELKNGENITIKELPLFIEQEQWDPGNTSGWATLPLFYLITDK